MRILLLVTEGLVKAFIIHWHVSVLQLTPIDPNGHFTELTMIPYLQSGTYTNTQRDRFSLTAGLDIQPVKNWFIFLIIHIN